MNWKSYFIRKKKPLAMVFHGRKYSELLGVTHTWPALDLNQISLMRIQETREVFFKLNDIPCTCIIGYAVCNNCNRFYNDTENFIREYETLEGIKKMREGLDKLYDILVLNVPTDEECVWNFDAYYEKYIVPFLNYPKRND